MLMELGAIPCNASDSIPMAMEVKKVQVYEPTCDLQGKTA